MYARDIVSVLVDRHRAGATGHVAENPQRAGGGGGESVREGARRPGRLMSEGMDRNLEWTREVRRMESRRFRRRPPYRPRREAPGDGV